MDIEKYGGDYDMPCIGLVLIQVEFLKALGDFCETGNPNTLDAVATKLAMEERADI